METYPLFTLSKHAFAFCGLLVALTTVGRAETAAPDGVLGQRYVSVNGDVVDFEFSRDHGYSTALGANLPVAPRLDWGLGYAYGWFNTTGLSVREHTLSTSLVWHADGPSLKPFAGAGLGYDWTRDYFNWTSVSDSRGRWSAAVGVEIPLGALTVTPSIGYEDWFDGGREGTMLFGVELNAWFTPRVGGFANFTHLAEYRDDAGSASLYRAGLRFKF